MRTEARSITIGDHGEDRFVVSAIALAIGRLAVPMRPVRP